MPEFKDQSVLDSGLNEAPYFLERAVNTKTSLHEKVVAGNAERQSNPSSITGVVEAIINDTVYGWATDSDSGLMLEAILDECIIGRGEAVNERKDLSASTRSAKGFAIKTDVAISPDMLIENRLRVVAILNGKSKELPVWPPLLEAGRLSRIDFDKVKSGWNSVPIKIREAAGKVISSSGGRSFKRMSSDGAVQVGRNGFYFLANGSNHLTKFYSGEISIDVGRWVECFKLRQAAVEAVGAQFVQIMIPEKSSVIHEYAPFTATPGSAPYLELVHQCADANIQLFDVLPEFLASRDRIKYFPQVDTHFSTDGAEFFTHRFLEYVGNKVSCDEPERKWLLFAGDLGARFNTDGDIKEIVAYYSTLRHNGVKLTPTLVSQFDPPSGHQGRQRIWNNKNAPIKKKVVCFGNSFFERGDTSLKLSWWFSHLFSEFHFIWSVNMSTEYIKNVKPDLVICQTIERFLTSTPKI